MKDILKRWFEKRVCSHEWEERYAANVYESDYDTRPLYQKVTLICKKCGKIKTIKV